MEERTAQIEGVARGEIIDAGSGVSTAVTESDAKIQTIQMTLKSLERLMHQQMGQLQMQSSMINTVPSYTDNHRNSG